MFDLNGSPTTFTRKKLFIAHAGRWITAEWSVSNSSWRLFDVPFVTISVIEHSALVAQFNTKYKPHSSKKIMKAQRDSGWNMFCQRKSCTRFGFPKSLFNFFFVKWSFFLLQKRLLYFAKRWFAVFFPFAKSTQWRWPSLFFRCFCNIVAIFSTFCLQLKLISSYWPIKMSHLHYQTRYGMGLFSAQRANLNSVELKINEAKPNLRWSNQAKPCESKQKSIQSQFTAEFQQDISWAFRVFTQ